MLGTILKDPIKAIDPENQTITFYLDAIGNELFEIVNDLGDVDATGPSPLTRHLSLKNMLDREVSVESFLHNQKKKRTSCDRSVDNFQRICSHGLRQLVDDKSVGSCQQTFCKLLGKTCNPQACCKSFQQVVTSLTWHNITKLTSLLQVVFKPEQACKVTTCNIKSLVIFAVYSKH